MGLGFLKEPNIGDLLLDDTQNTKLTLETKPQGSGGGGGGAANVQIQPQQPQQTQQPSQSSAQPKQAGGFFNTLASPKGRQFLLDIGGALGGNNPFVQSLTKAGRSSLNSEQFNKLTTKLQSGDEITNDDVIGLSSEDQIRALTITQSGAAGGRAERGLQLKEDAAPLENALTRERITAIQKAPERSLAEIEVRKQADVELEKLKQSGRVPTQIRAQEFVFKGKKFYGYVDPKSGEFVTLAEGQPTQRESTFGGGSSRQRAGTDIAASDLGLLGRQIASTKTFEALLDKTQNIFNARNTSSRREEFMRKLAINGATKKELTEALGREPSAQELGELKDINRFRQLNEIFKQRLEDQPQLNQGQGQGQNANSVIPNSMIPTIDAFLRSKTNSAGRPLKVNDANRLAVFNDPELRSEAGL